MKNRDNYTAFHRTLCAMIVTIGACSNPPPQTTAAIDSASTEIARDLNLAEGKTDVIQRTQSDSGREELGPREEAVVLTENNGIFTLRYAYRFPQSNNLNFRLWDIWVNHENAGDGTGAAVPAIKEFDQRPNSEQIAEFRSEIVNHWSAKP